MENITTIKVYNLLDANGNKLRLRLGRSDYFNLHIGDKGYRWSFVGTRIPMPVRAYTWFNGFPEPVMLEWLKGNGWCLRSIAYVLTGEVDVFDLPNGNEDLNIEITPERCEHDEKKFCEVIRELVNDGRKATATCLYRYANGGSLSDAFHAVTEICNET